MSADRVPPEKRDGRRYYTRRAVSYGLQENKLLTDYCINISAGGMFLESIKILPPKTELIVKFMLPDCDRFILSKARVAWANKLGAIKKESLPPGMGLQFLDLSLDNLQVIRSFLDKGKLNPTC